MIEFEDRVEAHCYDCKSFGVCCSYAENPDGLEPCGMLVSRYGSFGGSDAAMGVGRLSRESQTVRDGTPAGPRT